MKLLFDLFPVVLFFVAYKFADIYAATAVAIVASIAQIAWLKWRAQPVQGMQWASLVIIVIFGGMTLFLRDETFIKWKPTVLYISMAAALAFARWAMGRNLIRALMQAQVTLPEPVWDRLNLAWVGFFLSMSVINLYVAYTYTTEIWVNFKLFGTIGMTLVFVIAQAVYLGRFTQTEEPPRSGDDAAR